MTDVSKRANVDAGGDSSPRPRRHVVVAVPGLSGGIDEAARYVLPEGQLDQNWTAHTLVTKGQRGWLASFVFSRAMARLTVLRTTNRADVLHLNMSSRGSTLRKLILARLARVLGVPYVVQLHGGGFAAFVDRQSAPLRREIVAMLNKAEHIFVLGEPFRKFVVDSIGVDGAKVSIVRNAVPVNSDLPRLEAKVQAGPPSILFTGRVNVNKGAFDLLDALAQVQDLKWTAVLAGDGETERATERVRALGLQDRVTIRSWQSRSAVEALLAEATVFVLPSHLEALSVSLLEAMASQLCCIATTVGAHGEILVDQQNCLLVEPGDVDGLADCLRSSLNDSDLRQRLGVAAHNSMLEQCSIEVVQAELFAVYQDIVDQE